MIFETTPIADLLLVRPKRRMDARGFFSESWSIEPWHARGLEIHWCQDNHSLSRQPGVLRGLHYQAPPMAQAKLVRCTRGRVWDVAVDARRGSPSFGKSFGTELSVENWLQLFVPRGFLHGFLTLEPDSEVQYKVDNPYAPDCDGAVRWDDPDLAIEWPVTTPPILSDKDAAAPRFARWQTPFEFGDPA
ncbi:MAG TPA: dTDP-4-dehydrorhamnose 3,5-epimerase [Thermohalobaculum sp.]|nr:dTDP-4-dehydrorhamnose 3,5-epimerase [Thermohalobaculum sp.]